MQKRIIDIEVNAIGQLAKLFENHGFNISARILKYDGRPFTPDELEEKIKEVL